MLKCKKKDCIYCLPLAGGKEATHCCHYLLLTERTRDCPADNCDKYKPKEKKRNTKPQAFSLRKARKK